MFEYPDGGRVAGGDYSVMGLVEMGMRLYKRCHDEMTEPRKKRKDGVEDGDEEEDLIPVRFEGIDGQEDDGQTVICWPLRSGLLKPYTGDLKEYWSRQPRVVRPLREAYDTSFLGLDPVNPMVTKRDHDRGAPRTVKQYLKVNLRVSKTRATINSSGLESHDVGLSKDYQEPTCCYQVISGLWQYARNLWVIRPGDFSGFVMLSVLHDIKFFQPVLMAKVIGKSQRDAKQLECLKHFIDEAMARNSTRGRQSKNPMVYEELLSLARASANLIYSGTGVGLDWQVDHGTCSIDPYTLGDSSVSSGNGRAAEAVATPRGGRGGGGGRGGRGGGGGLGRGAGAVVSNTLPAGAGVGAAGGGHIGQLCSAWNQGNCRFLTACKFFHKCSAKMTNGSICQQGHKARDHK